MELYKKLGETILTLSHKLHRTEVYWPRKLIFTDVYLWRETHRCLRVYRWLYCSFYLSAQISNSRQYFYWFVVKKRLTAKLGVCHSLHCLEPNKTVCNHASAQAQWLVPLKQMSSWLRVRKFRITKTYNYYLDHTKMVLFLFI